MADDRQLWERICQGDVRAFDAFYRENAPRLEMFLRNVVGNRQAAEDLMQETFTQMWQRPNGFQPERGSLRAYLFGIGRKRAADWWRKREAPDARTQELADESRAETKLGVQEAFDKLPEELRTLIWLREVEGQSYAELAETFEIPIGTVRSRLFAAREALRNMWRGSGQQEKEKP